MNTIPEDIVELIITFTHDRQGYTYEEQKKYKRIKRKKFHRIKRILAELTLFHQRYDGIILRLKPNRRQRGKRSLFLQNLKSGTPTINYHTGLYIHSTWERRWLKELTLTSHPKWMETWEKVYNLSQQERDKELALQWIQRRTAHQKKWNRSMAGAAASIL
jgi:hypothetical protein